MSKLFHLLLCAFIVFSVSFVFADDDPYRLLVAVKKLGLLQEDPANSNSRNNFDKVYQEALLKSERFDEAIAYKNPLTVTIAELNQICFEMARKGRAKEAIEKLGRFEKHQRFTNPEVFERTLQPGLKGGQLLFAAEKGETDEVQKLAEKVLAIKFPADTSPGNEDSLAASLYGVLILYSLDHGQITQAAELFDLSSRSGEMQKTVGYRVIDQLKITRKLKLAVKWLNAIADNNPKQAIRLAARYLGIVKDPIWRYRTHQSENETRITMLSIIRKLESRLGSLVETEARGIQLQKPTTPEEQKIRIEAEFVEAFHQSNDINVKLQYAVKTRSREKIGLLAPLVNVADVGNHFFYRQQLIEAYLDTGDFSKANLEFSKLRIELNSKYWYQYGKLAVRMKKFELARQILETNNKKKDSYKFADTSLKKLELYLVANQTKFAESQPLIDLFTKWNESRSKTAIYNYFESTDILGHIVQKDYRVAEQIIEGIPNDFFTQTPSRSLLRRSLLHALLMNGKISEAENYAKSYKSVSLTIHLIRHYYYVGDRERVKEMALHHLRSSKPSFFVWTTIEPEWLDECVAAIEDSPKESIAMFLLDSAWGLQRFKDEELILELAELIEQPRQRGQFLLNVADYWESDEYLGWFEFPMKFPNSR